MITAAIHGTTVSPKATEHQGDDFILGNIASEIAERICEMNETKTGAGTDLVLRLAAIARMDRGSFALVASVMHGDTSVLTDSYAERTGTCSVTIGKTETNCGRKKQSIHYRTLQDIDKISALFPEVAAILSQVRLSVKHHEDPLSQGQVIRDACEV